MIFSFLFIYIFVVNIVYYVVHIVCEVDVIANSLVLYLPFCSTLNKNFFFFFFFSNVLTAKAISRALLSSYLTRHMKNIYSVATTPLQFRNGVYNFVTELIIFCVMYSLIIHLGIKKYELSLTIDIGLLYYV